MSEVAKFFQAAAVAVVGVAAPLMPMQSSRTVMPPSLLQQHRDAGNMARQLARQLAQQLAQQLALQLAQQLVQKLARQLVRQCTHRRAPQLKKQLAQRQGQWPRNPQKLAAMQRARKIPTLPYGLLQG